MLRHVYSTTSFKALNLALLKRSRYLRRDEKIPASLRMPAKTKTNAASYDIGIALVVEKY